MLFGDGITLGKIFGITIRIDYSWFVVFALISFSLSSNYFPGNYPKFDPLTYAVLGIITTILFFVSALVHELSHSVVANRLGLKVERITLFVFGGAAQLSDEPKNPSVEFSSGNKIRRCRWGNDRVVTGSFGLSTLLFC